jgi:superfamily II DNA helicase RecQ
MIKLFIIPVHDSERGEQEVNSFCSAHTITAVDKQFVADGANSFWSFCITWRTKENTVLTAGKGKIDYRTVLNDQDFQLFVKLRDLRKSTADSEGVPAYALFTNEQLATMVTNQTTTKSGLAGIEGVGAARIDKYGARFLEVLQQATAVPPSGMTDEAPPA